MLKGQLVNLIEVNSYLPGHVYEVSGTNYYEASGATSATSRSPAAHNLASSREAFMGGLPRAAPQCMSTLVCSCVFTFAN